MIIVMAAIKGGVGKTTVAVGLAEILSQASGQPALLLDLDPQGSATRWAESAELTSEVKPLIARSSGQLPRLIREAVKGYEWVIVDTPPGDIGIVDAAIGEADIVMIPFKPTTMDLPQAVETWHMSEGVPSVAVLTQVQPNTVQAPAAARQVLADAGIAVLDTEIRQWQAIAQMAGASWPPNERVRELFEALGSELLAKAEQ
jgi:chromosome partitioning protein